MLTGVYVAEYIAIEAVFDAGTVTGASTQLGEKWDKGRISKLIKSYERKLGREIFYRTRGMEPTPELEVEIESIRSALWLLRRAEAGLRK